MQACLRLRCANYLGHRLKLYPGSVTIQSWKLIGSHPRGFGPPSAHTIAPLSVRQASKPRTFPIPPEDEQKPSSWVAQLEKYLPQELCSNPKNLTVREEPELEQCLAILDLLDLARRESAMGYDLLAWLGIEEGRWPAVLAIVNKLLDNAVAQKRKPGKMDSLPSNIDWASMGSFDTISGNQLNLDQPQVNVFHCEGRESLESGHTYTDEPTMTCRMSDVMHRVGTMEELWPALGQIVLKATDLSPEKSRIAMFYFYQIVARLHHLDLIPHEVYKYVPQDADQPNRRTPAMQLLSSHIMNVLSDAVWIAQEVDTAATAMEAGQEDKEAIVTKYKMKVRPLGPEIWLEFILWCCVEGGFSVEGALILQESMNTKNGWNVKSFADQHLDLHSIDSSKIDRYDTWISCAEGPKRVLTSESDGPFIGLGKRTISSEVVTSLIDGLCTSVSAGIGQRGGSSKFIIRKMQRLIMLLEHNGIELRPRDIDQFVIRMLESRGVVPNADPRSTERLLLLGKGGVAHNYVSRTESFGDSSETEEHTHLLDRSAVVLGLNHYVLSAYAGAGRLLNADSLLRKLDTVSLAMKSRVTPQGATDVAPMEEREAGELSDALEISAETVETTTEETIEDGSKVKTPPLEETLPEDGLNAESLTGFPSSSLSHLLDLSTGSGTHDIANRLLFSSDEYSDPVIPPAAYSDNLLGPAIIRFAAATKNEELLSVLANHLPRRLPNPILKSLVLYAIQRCDWDRLDDILLHLQDARGYGWGAGQVASLGAAVIRLDKAYQESKQQSPDAPKPADLLKAEEFLIRFLKGGLNPQPKYHEGPPIYHQAVLYQFKRVFESIDGAISDLSHNIGPQWTSSLPPRVKIPSYAFNEILSAVIESRGTYAGRVLFEKCCMKPLEKYRSGGNLKLHTTSQIDSPSLRRMQQQHIDLQFNSAEYDQPVRANIQTLRIISRAAVRELSELQPDCEAGVRFLCKSTVEWCERQFRHFLPSGTDRDAEFSSYLEGADDLNTATADSKGAGMIQ
ncbi:hypothetical protein FQN51_004237 [Onygenales sp. PD_10]|nr:hypothetical protein FQN51_004237 [Onygenales sp. PD_10]